MNHQKLTEIAGKWLKKHTRNMVVPNCSTVVTELVSGVTTGEIPDVIGWCSWTSVLIEVKVSRSDFLKDKKKMFREFQDFGMGEHRYYCCPEGLITKGELPEKWGLLYCNSSGKIRIEKEAMRTEANLHCERTLLLSLLRRAS